MLLKVNKVTCGYFMGMLAAAVISGTAAAVSAAVVFYYMAAKLKQHAPLIAHFC